MKIGWYIEKVIKFKEYGPLGCFGQLCEEMSLGQEAMALDKHLGSKSGYKPEH